MTTQGHINAMLDADGILRHHMLQLELSDGRIVSSMALALEPPQVVAILNRYLTLIADCILKNGGTLDEIL